MAASVLRVAARHRMKRRSANAWRAWSARSSPHGCLAIDVAGRPAAAVGLDQPADLFARAARPAYWFVNGRAVRDRLLINAVKLGYRDVLYGGRHPAYVLSLSIDPREVDVNAHPPSRSCASANPRGVHDFIQRSRGNGAVADAAGCAGTAPSVAAPQVQAPRPAEFDFASSRRGTLVRHRQRRARWAWAVRDAMACGGSAAESASRPLRADARSRWVRPSRSCMASTSWRRTRQGLVLVDMHAGHERVLYEKMKADHAARRADAQQLLEPVVVELPEPVVDAGARGCSRVVTLRVRARSSSRPIAWRCAACPRCWRARTWRRWCATTAMAVASDEGTHHVEGAEHRLLATLACRGAVHAGRRLSACRRWMRCCARWSRPTAPASAITAGRPSRAWRWPIWIACSCAAGSAVANPQRCRAASPFSGPTGSGKSALALRLARAAAGGNHQRGFGAGVSRHGHRHRQAHARQSARRCRIT